MDEEKPQSQGWWQRAKSGVTALPGLVRNEIWHPDHLDDKSARAHFFGFLRVFALTVDGVRANRIPGQAAALSYYTLIALGPLIAITIMISGFVLPEGGRDRIADSLTDAVYFVAPSAAEASKSEVKVPDDDAAPSEPAELETVQEQIVENDLEKVIDTLVENSRSSTVGVVGSLVLILISIRLLSTIENTYNSIWGVQQGRNFFQQVIFYWTIISLGAVSVVALITLGAGKVASYFDFIPYSAVFLEWILSLAPLLIFIITVFLLAAFNRFIPNARVNWRPAFLGALCVTLLLYLNQSLSFFYIGFVIRQKSLFGAVGILPVFLFGLFVFWVFLLLGGQITYALQNVNRLTHQRAWDGTSRRAQELLAVTTMVIIARRFENCERPLTADELSERIRVPSNILNHTIHSLMKIGLLVAVEPDDKEDAIRYQPGRPVDSITPANLKERLELEGNNEALPLLTEADPVVRRYRELVLDLQVNHGEPQTLKDLIRNSEPRSSKRKA